MRRAWLAWLAWLAGSACGFVPGMAAPDAAPASDAPEEPFCDPQDPALVVCFELEGDTRDSSGHGLHASMVDVQFVPGRVGLAMQFGATSAADVPDSPHLDVAAVTIEAWIRPSELPAAGTRMGIVDNHAQWGLFLHEGGELHCQPSAARVAANIAANTWTHVACTHDGTTGRVYVDGRFVGEQPAGPLATGGSTGLSIAADNPPGSGSRLIGLIDELRILGVARAPALP